MIKLKGWCKNFVKLDYTKNRSLPFFRLSPFEAWRKLAIKLKCSWDERKKFSLFALGIALRWLSFVLNWWLWAWAWAWASSSLSFSQFLVIMRHQIVVRNKNEKMLPKKHSYTQLLPLFGLPSTKHSGQWYQSLRTADRKFRYLVEGAQEEKEEANFQPFQRWISGYPHLLRRWPDEYKLGHVGLPEMGDRACSRCYVGAKLSIDAVVIALTRASHSCRQWIIRFNMRSIGSSDLLCVVDM